MKKSGLLFLILSFAMSAHAQFSFEGGLNMSNLSIKVNDTKIPTKYIAGASFGIVGGIPLSDEQHVFLELAAFYQTDGAKIPETKTSPEWTYNLSSITFPINIEYKSGEKCSKRFFFGAGAYIRDILSGSAYTFNRNGLSAEYTTLKIGTDIKRIDMGFGVNLGYLGKKHWYIRGNYAIGLKNDLVRGDDKNHIKQSTGGLTLGYVFRGCKYHNWVRMGRSRSTDHWRGIKKNKWSTHQRLYRTHGPGAY